MQNAASNNYSTSSQATYEAEATVLGALILDGQLVNGVNIEPNHFTDNRHRLIMEAVQRLEEKGEPIELPSIAIELGDAIEAVSIAYLGQLAESVPSTKTIDYYATRVKEFAIDRQAKYFAVQFINGDLDRENMLAKLNELDMQRTDRKAKTMADLTTELYEDLIKDKAEITGVQTGFGEYDQMTDGWQRGDLIVIAARPAMGKTAWALNTTTNVAKKKSTSSLFNYEMMSLAIGRRFYSSNSNIQSHRLKNGARMEDEDWMRFANGSQELSNLPIMIHDASGMKVRDIRRAVAQDMKILGCDSDSEPHVVMIDYLQLITPDRPNDNDTVKIAEITRQLKLMAKQLGIVVVLLSQLSRGVEQRQDKRPIMSDLRGSGAIEQDADGIGFLYRDEYYNKDSEDANIVELIVAKNRDGGTGTVKLLFQKEYGKMLSIEEREYEPAR